MALELSWANRLRAFVERTSRLRDPALQRLFAARLARSGLVERLEPERPYLVHQDHRIVLASRGFAAGVGCDDPRELVGVAIAGFCHDDDRTYVDGRIASIYEAQVPNRPLLGRVRKCDGRIWFLEFLGFPMEHQGRPAGLTLCYRRVWGGTRDLARSR
jgi:PAS domain-containing protein